MTRINAGIPPENLTDQHLMAEFREITRIASTSTWGAPSSMCLGKGHMKFFAQYQGYCAKRREELYDELTERGFDVNYYTVNWKNVEMWVPSSDDRAILTHRIKEKILSSKCQFRYYGKPVSKHHAIKLLKQ